MLYCECRMVSTESNDPAKTFTYPIDEGTDVLVDREIATPWAEAGREPGANSYRTWSVLLKKPHI